MEGGGTVAIVTCASNHTFDDTQYHVCPFCGDRVGASKKIVIVTSGKGDNTQQFTERFDEDNATEEELTISINMAEGKNSLTTGWLICTKGDNIGKSFPIKTGRCFIGRDYDMDIVIPDKDVTRINHASIVYDSKDDSFYAVHGANTVTVNGEVVKESKKLAEDDVIIIGKAEYVFIPYCKKGRNWNEK